MATGPLPVWHPVDLPPIPYATSRSSDLFASVHMGRYRDAADMLERSVDEMFSKRHDYPIWPLHNSPLDPYEVSFHGLIRRPYYKATIQMVRALRELRKLA